MASAATLTQTTEAEAEAGSPTPNQEEALLLEEAHRAVASVLADRLASVGGAEESSSLRLDVLLGSFPGLTREGLLEEVRARGKSGGGGDRPEDAAGRVGDTSEEGKTAEEEEDAPQPKRKRGRPRKVQTTEDAGGKTAGEDAPQPKRKRGRPRKVQTPTGDAGGKTAEEDAPQPKRKRGRPRKDQTTGDAVGSSKKPRKATAPDFTFVYAPAAVEKSAQSKKVADLLAEREREKEEEEKLKKKERKRDLYRQKVQENSDRYFDTMLEELRQFRAEHGHANVPQKHNSRLSTWVNTQRKEYKWLRDGYRKSHLTAQRIQRLSDLGFKFSLRKAGKNYTFEERLGQLRKAKSELGLGSGSELGTFKIDDVPKNRDSGAAAGGDDPYEGLHAWLQIQTELYRGLVAGKKKKFFTEERAQQLMDLGFELPTETKLDRAWEERFQELLDYAREHGNCLVKKNHPGGLGHWVLSQRKRYTILMADQYGGNEEDLFSQEERLRRLQDIGFCWRIRYRRWRRKPVEEPWE